MTEPTSQELFQFFSRVITENNKLRIRIYESIRKQLGEDFMSPGHLELIAIDKNDDTAKSLLRICKNMRLAEESLLEASLALHQKVAAELRAKQQ